MKIHPTASRDNTLWLALKADRARGLRRTMPSDHSTANAATHEVGPAPSTSSPAKNTAKLAAIAPTPATGTTIASRMPASPMNSASSQNPSSTIPHWLRL